MSQHPSAEPAFDYAHIRDAQDRSYSLALVGRLGSPDISEKERDDIAHALRALGDWRTFEPLFQLLHDPLAQESARHQAGMVLRWVRQIDRQRARTYFFSPDPVLQRQGLMALGFADADLVESIACRPEHPLHLWAIDTMDFRFDSPRLQELTIKALSHPNPKVRIAAAWSFYGGPPEAANEPLFAAAFDPVDDVACAAIQMLEWVTSIRCVQVLGELMRMDEPIANLAKLTLPFVRNSIVDCLLEGGPQHSRLLRWIAPVRDILALRPDEIEPECEELEDDGLKDYRWEGTQQVVKPGSERISAGTIIRLLDDPNGLWGGKLDVLLHRASSAAIVGDDRERLSEFILKHPDARVRCEGGRLLAEWNDHERLIELALDKCPSWEISPMRWLGQTSACPGVARRIKERILVPEAEAFEVSDALRTYVVHAPRNDSIELCQELALRDQRQRVRVTAVDMLIRLQARDIIESLRFLLKEPPIVSWWVHTELLEACRKLGVIPTGIEMLREVDNLDVQEAVGWFD